MDERAHAVLTLAMDLPGSSRAEIAAALLASLEPAPDADVEKAWRHEVALRVAALDTGDFRSVPWNQVRDALRTRLRHRRED